MKILVPIDGSEFSKHSIEFVTSRATLLGHNPEIELLSVQAPVPARASKLIGNGSLSGYYDEEANVILEPAIEALKAAGVKATARYAVGEAAPTIAKVAEKSGADLQRVISGRRFVAQDQDGFVAERQDGIGNRTKQEALQGRAAMRTHDDQIGAGFFSNFSIVGG